MKYGRKVVCLRLPDEVNEEARTWRSNKGRHAADDNREGGTGKKWQQMEGS
jgi:hypothetical protein